jgi:hypothetical protein
MMTYKQAPSFNMFLTTKRDYEIPIVLLAGQSVTDWHSSVELLAPDFLHMHLSMSLSFSLFIGK